MNCTLITFAVEEEARPFRRLSTPLALPVLVTGMGSSNAERSLRAALAGLKPDRVLTCGFAGALNPSLPLRTVLFSIDEDLDLAPALMRAGARPVRFHQADRVVITAAEKRVLRQATGADAVEMESGTIRAICREGGIPSATVRVVSDPADEDLPLDFNRLTGPDVRFRYGLLARAVLRSPQRIPGLIRMGYRVRSAARELATVLSCIVRPLTGPEAPPGGCPGSGDCAAGW